MSWTAPVTQTTGTLITAAIWNAQITDNMTYLKTMDLTGMIVMRDGSCPSGWTRVSAFDGKFVRGASSYGGSGGSDTHTHTGPSHTHTVASHTHTGPSHTHTVASHTHTGPSHTHAQNLGNAFSSSAYVSASGVLGASPTGNGEDIYGINGSGGSAGKYIQSGVQAGGTGATGGQALTTDAGGTGATGGQALTTDAGGTGATGSGSTLPAYLDIVFCKKD
jgi:hypothetical protein